VVEEDVAMARVWISARFDGEHLKVQIAGAAPYGADRQASVVRELTDTALLDPIRAALAAALEASAAKIDRAAQRAALEAEGVALRYGEDIDRPRDGGPAGTGGGLSGTVSVEKV
jgi:hypothetical protein